MIRSFFTATSGVITDNKNLTVHSNNIANINTNGFKKDIPLTETFAGMLLTRVATNDSQTIGGGDFMDVSRGVYTDHSAGAFVESGRPYDFAIRGDGYFVVQDEADNQFLTRDGAFYLDDNGYLCHVRGGQVLSNTGEAIELTGDDFYVDDRGNISEDGQIVATLALETVEQPDTLVTVGEGFFNRPEEGTQAANGTILWKQLEHSNVNITQEMSDIIAASRHFQACSQIMKMTDELTQKTVSEIAKM